MSATPFQFTCGKCAYQFIAPEIPNEGYGEFVMRSEKDGCAAYVDALSNDVFSEVGALVRRVLETGNEKRYSLAQLQQKAFSVACDLSPDGTPYRIGLPPKCPRCGARNPAAWEGKVTTDEIRLPHVTHVVWSQLNMAERLARIRGELI